MYYYKLKYSTLLKTAYSYFLSKTSLFDIVWTNLFSSYDSSINTKEIYLSGFVDREFVVIVMQNMSQNKALWVKLANVYYKKLESD